MSCLDKAKYRDMPTVFEILADADETVVAYPMYEPWLDVGRPDDLDAARLSVRSLSSNELITK